MNKGKPITSITTALKPFYKLPPLPSSQWDGDSRYTWTGKAFEYTEDDLREYGRRCFEEGVDLGKRQEKSSKR